MKLWARGKALALAGLGVVLGWTTWTAPASAAGAASAPAPLARSSGKRVSGEAAAKKRASRDGAKIAVEREPAAKKATKPKKRAKVAGPAVARHAKPKAPCMHAPVEIVRGFGAEAEQVVLTRCDGKPAPIAAMHLSILARPMSAVRPALPTTPVRHPEAVARREWAPGVKLVDEGLTTRLQKIADKFPHKKITIVSGYRPSSRGSFHQSAKAIDLALDGVKNEDLVAFCRTLPDTGCGYYPNSSFVHVDVRPPRTGHVYWIDASGPGEPARYVPTWPIREETGRALDIPRPDPAAPADDNSNEEAVSPQLAPGASDGKVDATTTEPEPSLAPLGEPEPAPATGE